MQWWFQNGQRPARICELAQNDRRRCETAQRTSYRSGKKEKYISELFSMFLDRLCKEDVKQVVVNTIISSPYSRKREPAQKHQSVPPPVPESQAWHRSHQDSGWSDLIYACLETRWALPCGLCGLHQYRESVLTLLWTLPGKPPAAQCLVGGPIWSWHERVDTGWCSRGRRRRTGIPEGESKCSWTHCAPKTNWKREILH